MSASNTARAKLFYQVPLWVRSLGSPLGAGVGRVGRWQWVMDKDGIQEGIDYPANHTPFLAAVRGVPGKEGWGHAD